MSTHHDYESDGSGMWVGLAGLALVGMFVVLRVEPDFASQAIVVLAVLFVVGVFGGIVAGRGRR